MDTGFSTNTLYTACRLSLTHHYTHGDTRTSGFGTGFLVEFPSPDNRVALVTNRHVVDLGWADPAKEGTLVEEIKLQWWQSTSLRLEHTITEPAPLFHDDPSIDVAIIPIASKPDTPIEIFGTFYGDVSKWAAGADENTLTFYHALSWEYLLECEQLWPQIQPGDFVAFPGYPIWYDRLQIRPVLRSGMIASDPQTDYRLTEGDPKVRDGNQQVLFDAFSTGGNSGSPVYVAQQGLPPFEVNIPQGSEKPPAKGKMSFTNYRRCFLIGINMGHINDVESERPNDHAGLSRMHKLSAIMDILRANATPHSSDARRINVRIPTETPTQPDQE
ncbi:S1 family peptidase [Mycobacterium sp. NPDC004974]